MQPGPRCRRPRRHESDQVSDRHGTATATATATAVLSGADLLGRSSTRLACCPALYDDELCFGLVAAWTDVGRSLVRCTCERDYTTAAWTPLV